MVTMGPTLTPIVKYLVIANALGFLWSTLAGAEIIVILGLSPALFLGNLFLWQVITYLFLHGGFFHLFWNMVVVWMFGCELERYLGGRRFLQFYLVTGIGAGLLSVAISPFSPIPIIGASGAVYGILMAYGMLFPERYVYLYFLFPVKVKYFVAVIGALAFFSCRTTEIWAVYAVGNAGDVVSPRWTKSTLLMTRLSGR